MPPRRHAELYQGRFGEIGIACFCTIGRDHTFADWDEAGRPATVPRLDWGFR